MEKKRLFIGNLAYDVTKEELSELLSGYGSVESIAMGKGDGYAKIAMSTPQETENVLSGLEGFTYRGRELHISEVVDRKTARKKAVYAYKERGKDLPKKEKPEGNTRDKKPSGSKPARAEKSDSSYRDGKERTWDDKRPPRPRAHKSETGGKPEYKHSTDRDFSDKPRRAASPRRDWGGAPAGRSDQRPSRPHKNGTGDRPDYKRRTEEDQDTAAKPKRFSSPRREFSDSPRGRSEQRPARSYPQDSADRPDYKPRPPKEKDYTDKPRTPKSPRREFSDAPDRADFKPVRPKKYQDDSTREKPSYKAPRSEGSSYMDKVKDRSTKPTSSIKDRARSPFKRRGPDGGKGR